MTVPLPPPPPDESRWPAPPSPVAASVADVFPAVHDHGLPRHHVHPEQSEDCLRDVFGAGGAPQGHGLALGPRPFGEALLTVQSGLPPGGDGARRDGVDPYVGREGARQVRVSCTIAALLTPYAMDEPPAR